MTSRTSRSTTDAAPLAHPPRQAGSGFNSNSGSSSSADDFSLAGSVESYGLVDGLVSRHQPCHSPAFKNQLSQHQSCQGQTQAQTQVPNQGQTQAQTLIDQAIETAPPAATGYFDYFAYGSCMCPVDLRRSIGEPAHPYVLGPAVLDGYRLGFNLRSHLRNCGVLDIVPDPKSRVHGVLYRLPWRASEPLDEREQVPEGNYRRAIVTVTTADGQHYGNVRTYMVVKKLARELAPNDWYFNTVLRGAMTCGLPEDYCWQLFHYMHRLQQVQQAHRSSQALPPAV